MNTPLNIVFAGTPDFAARHLQALLDSSHHVIGVYSQPDRPAGRGNKLQASAVKQLALQYALPVYQPESLKTLEAQQQLASLQADVMVVVAYGLLLPLPVLNTPAKGCLNVHGSLLPKWRGAAPIQRSIWAGDKETGVTIMQMDQGLDTGPMLHKRSLAIEPDDTSASLYDKLAAIGPEALLYTLDNLTSLQAEVQSDTQASYAKKLSKEEAQIDWSKSATQLEREIRAFNPWPVSFFEHANLTIKVWQSQIVSATHAAKHPGEVLKADKHGIVVQTGEDCLLLTSIQLPGKKPMSITDVLNGRSELFVPGTRL